MAGTEESKHINERLLHDLIRKVQSYKDTYTITVAGHEFIMYPDVFNPDVFRLPNSIFDMWLHLIRTIKPNSLLEIGAGAGYFSVLAALNGANRVTATDITQEAVANIQANVDKYNLANRMQVLRSNVFELLDKNDRFDMIFWDFPFTHIDKSFEELNALERTVFDPNHQFIEIFIRDAHKHLNDTGRLFIMFFPKLGDSDSLLKLTEKYEWHLQFVENPDYKTTSAKGTDDNDININFYGLIKKNGKETAKTVPIHKNRI